MAVALQVGGTIGISTGATACFDLSFLGKLMSDTARNVTVFKETSRGLMKSQN